MEQQLIKKAESLFLRYGIRSVSMDDIARELGVSKKTLYQLVENKTDLIRQIFAYRNEEESKAISLFIQESKNAIDGILSIARYMIDRLRLISPSFRYDLEKYYPTVSKELDDFHWNYFLSKIEANLEQGKKEALYRQSINVNIIARLFMGMMNNIGHDQFFPVHDFPLEDLVSRSFLYHLHGVASEKGRDVLCEYLGDEDNECL